MRVIEPDIGATAGILRREKPDMHRCPTLVKRRVDDADLRAPDNGRGRASRARCDLREEAHALAERPRLDLEERARVARSAVLEGILLDLVDHGATGRAPAGREIAWPIGADLESEAVPHPFAEPDELALAGRAIGLELNLGTLGRRDPAGQCRHLGGARAGVVADVALRRAHHLAGAFERVALLDRDADDRLAERVRDDPDA
jgi:hypothetical protein